MFRARVRLILPPAARGGLKWVLYYYYYHFKGHWSAINTAAKRLRMLQVEHFRSLLTVSISQSHFPVRSKFPARSRLHSVCSQGHPTIIFGKLSVRKTILIDLRCRIFWSFSEKFLACLPILGFSNFKKISSVISATNLDTLYFVANYGMEILKIVKP